MMKLQHLTLLILFGIILFQGCSKKNEEKVTYSKELLALADMMTGSFSNSEQAKVDSNYYDIQLEMVQIWPERNDGIWLYIEQTVVADVNRPYRQRIYQLQQTGETTFTSDVFLLPGDPLHYAGAYKDPAKLQKIKRKHVIERDGCTIYINRLDSLTYTGETRDHECRSHLRKASYATSQVRITPEEVCSWERGWDENDKQVWGAEKDGYHYKKIKNYPLLIQNETTDKTE